MDENNDFEFLFDGDRPEYGNFNISNDVLCVMINAKSVCVELGEPEITAADFIIGSLNYYTTHLYKFLSKKVDYVDVPEDIVAAIISDKKAYKKITGICYSDFLKYRDGTGTDEIVFKAENGEEQDVFEDVTLNSSFWTDYSEELQEAFIKAKELENANGSNVIQLDTLIFCVLSNKSSKANTVLRHFFTTEGLIPYLRKNTNTTQNKETTSKLLSDKLPKELKTYVTNLNVKYADKEKCNILERDDEIAQLWNIISKKKKRNAILIGEPGVGKSAIVEAVTCSIINKTCPKDFKDYTVYSLDINSMVAGTKYRGEFEQKVQDFIQYVEKESNIIIFIDEIHHMRGAGNADSSGPDLAGSLKPILARGDVVLIGATTTEEYEKIFSKDGALSRRFETIIVKEPKFDKVKPMIKAQVEALSKYHNVEVSDEMLDRVQLCASSFEKIANPDKTLDVLDRSMAMARICKSKELKFEHIEKVYKKNFENYKKIPMSKKKSTAYHEAGHCAAWILSKTKSNEDLVLVSIVPAQWWLGVNCFEFLDINNCEKDITYFKERISIDLAGRIAQSFVTKGIDAGASADLQNATKIAEDYIMKYGLDDGYINYSFDTDSNLNISNKMTDDIRERAKKFINEVYKETEELLRANRKSIDNIAKLLLEKGMITKKEALRAFYKDSDKSKKRTTRKKENKPKVEVGK